MKAGLIIGLIIVCITLIISCQNEDQIEFNRYYTSGSVIYQSKCQNCHGAKGEGLSALIPPLTDSVYLKTNKQALPCMVKNGLNGSINMTNKTFEGQMPANDLAPIELAEVLTYITNSFGNKMGAITAQQINADLSKCK